MPAPPLTCDPASALSTKKNQIWRLIGKAP
jgi:hypothetical protein